MAVCQLNATLVFHSDEKAGAKGSPRFVRKKQMNQMYRYWSLTMILRWDWCKEVAGKVDFDASCLGNHLKKNVFLSDFSQLGCVIFTSHWEKNGGTTYIDVDIWKKKIWDAILIAIGKNAGCIASKTLWADCWNILFYVAEPIDWSWFQILDRMI